MAKQIGALGHGVKDAPFSANNLLTPGMSLEEVAINRGMNFNIGEAPAGMLSPDGAFTPVEGKKVLYRDDTNAPLSVVGDKYKPVSPIEMLQFYEDIYNAGGFNMKAAGCLRGGARFWSIAETNNIATLPGGDKIGQYIFMGTAVDGSLATTAFTFANAFSCWNCAPMMIQNAQQNQQFIKVPHSRVFLPADVQEQFKLVGESFKKFEEDARFMSDRRITAKEALRYFGSVYAEDKIPEAVQWTKAEGAVLEDIASNKRVQIAMDLWFGAGIGSNVKARKGTLWGAYNAVTELQDHHNGAQTQENAFHSNNLGTGFKVKISAWNHADMMLQAA